MPSLVAIAAALLPPAFMRCTAARSTDCGPPRIVARLGGRDAFPPAHSPFERSLHRSRMRHRQRKLPGGPGTLPPRSPTRQHGSAWQRQCRARQGAMSAVVTCCRDWDARDVVKTEPAEYDFRYLPT